MRFKSSLMLVLAFVLQFSFQDQKDQEHTEVGMGQKDLDYNEE